MRVRDFFQERVDAFCAGTNEQCGYPVVTLESGLQSLAEDESGRRLQSVGSADEGPGGDYRVDIGIRGLSSEAVSALLHSIPTYGTYIGGANLAESILPLSLVRPLFLAWLRQGGGS
jgi:hypothetical protein